jgi:hypothetical protein
MAAAQNAKRIKMNQHISIFIGKNSDNLQNRVEKIRDAFMKKIPIQFGDLKVEIELLSMTFHHKSNGWYLECEFLTDAAEG